MIPEFASKGEDYRLDYLKSLPNDELKILKKGFESSKVFTNMLKEYAIHIDDIFRERRNDKLNELGI
jgi:hypothetical protein